jgi:Ca-activated chloride channel family protein
MRRWSRPTALSRADDAVRFLHVEIGWSFAILVVVALAIRSLLRRPLGLATTTVWSFGREYRASVFRRAPLALCLLAMLLLGCALMDPVIPFIETDVRSRGLDIVMAVDLSASMQEQMDRPLAPTRLDAVKASIKAFVARRIDDRIGLVVFSDNAYVVAPLTFDHGALVRYIDSLDGDMLRGEGLTAIGEGLGLSNVLLTKPSAQGGARNKVIVLFTDGENTAGRDPMAALAQSDAAGIRVHMVGIDLEDEIRTKPQVRTFVRAVERYGGRSFNAASARALEEASRSIDGIEKGVLLRRTYERDAPVFQWFAIPALIALATAFMLRAVPALIDQT